MPFIRIMLSPTGREMKHLRPARTNVDGEFRHIRVSRAVFSEDGFFAGQKRAALRNRFRQSFKSMSIALTSANLPAAMTLTADCFAVGPKLIFIMAGALVACRIPN